MWRFLIAVLLVFLPLTALAVDGTFQGRVVNPPIDQPAVPGWIYVQGRNHLLRRVEVSHAEIVLGMNVPSSQKHKCTMDCLSAGDEIRVTAEQDRKGEWRAKKVEILTLTTNRI